ncbi:DUF302 domain-containing protein [Salisediminibacterium halotolerans]|uniref:DUF302 domain-containing protein n=1 Tax=Salisediminibacterium halotolerans TaxID=517425 RepID=UPI000EB39C9C|nr:DUF302 domain-containing protein [Salisediminibacterium halotolerans]RLJ72320.1 uncharacterized protein (DUF302 family) [Actinophytocola xinjiangensis]RPE85534.1 uncharacterized protein (DUF302 family) [Salisediminibacterium halotolerans]TWG33489.1 uncharacterized protein (DUF302 family) [Salisediminibacterium halotolerans]GEL09017.1 hypothetical protein SHA02_24330 [Salisediminibacterium halotolerans]
MTFDYTISSDKNLDELIQSLETSLQNEGFAVLWHFDVKATLHKKGFDYDDEYRILEVCNPGVAKEMLDETKMAGYFLPCKVTVFESGGKTYVGMPKPTTLFNLTDNETARHHAADVEQQMIKCFEKAV